MELFDSFWIDVVCRFPCVVLMAPSFPIDVVKDLSSSWVGLLFNNTFKLISVIFKLDQWSWFDDSTARESIVIVRNVRLE